MSGYGLDDRALEVRSLGEARDFSSNLCVQTGFGAHPVSCTMGTGVLSAGVKRGRGLLLTAHPHLVPRSWMSRSYTSSPPCASIGVLWDCFTYINKVCGPQTIIRRTTGWRPLKRRLKSAADMSILNREEHFTCYRTGWDVRRHGRVRDTICCVHRWHMSLWTGFETQWQ
jgi:hypothetical protein